MFTGKAHSPPRSRIRPSTALTSSRELPPALTFLVPKSRASAAILPAWMYFLRTSWLTEGILNLLLGYDALPDELDSAIGNVHYGRRGVVLRLAAVDADLDVPLQVLLRGARLYRVWVRVQIGARGRGWAEP